MSTSVVPTQEAQVRIRAILAQSSAPLSLSILEKQTRIKREDLKALLVDGIERDSIYRWPDYRGSQRYWHVEPNKFAREQILASASELAQKTVDLRHTSKKRLPGFPDKLIASLIQELVREGKLKKFPALGREAFLLGSHPEAYAAAAQRVITAILEKVHKAGVAKSSSGDAILKAMAELEPSGQAPVSVRELRAALPQLSKQAFDDAALKLRNEEKVFLNRHDFPQSLPAAELENLIDGRDGNYFIAISSRYE
jgi:hypothetical protein